MRRAFIAVGLALVFAAPAAAQPNVLLIVTDDQRWDTLGYMPTVSTELVGNGVTFENSFVVNPVCCPSRASILTGQWSHTHGVWGIAGTYGGFHRFDDVSTLATWLHAAGYRTGLFGKYLNGYQSPDYVPPGWDEWFAFTLNPNAYFDYWVTERSARPPTAPRISGSDRSRRTTPPTYSPNGRSISSAARGRSRSSFTSPRRRRTSAGR